MKRHTLIVNLCKGLSYDGDPMTEIHSGPKYSYLGCYDSAEAQRLGLPVVTRKRDRIRARLTLTLLDD